MFSRITDRQNWIENHIYHYFKQYAYDEKSEQNILLGLSVSHRVVQKNGRTLEYFLVRSPLCDTSHDNHIRIDRFVLKETASTPVSYLFSCCHETMYKEESGQKTEVARSYYNEHGGLINYTVHNISEDGSEVLVPRNGEVRAQLQTRSYDIFNLFFEPFFKERYNKKEELTRNYWAIELSLSRVQQEFKASNFSQIEKRDEAIKLIDTMIMLLEDMRVFNDLKKYSCVDVLKRNRQFLETYQNNTISITNDNDIESVSGELPQAEMIKKKSNKKNKKLSQDKKFEDNFDEIISELQKKNVPEKIAELKRNIQSQDIEKAHSLCMEISTVSSASEMKEIFEFFLNEIIVCKDERCAERLSKIGDIFYDHSSHYRDLVFLKSLEEGCIEKGADITRRYGVLLKFFLDNKFNAFAMFLKHGASVATYLTVERLGKKVAFPLTVAIINNFLCNPDGLRFIEILREYNLINEDISSSQEFCCPPDGADFNEDFYCYPQEIARTKNIFSLAMWCVKLQPNPSCKLMMSLASHATLKQIIIETLNLMMSGGLIFIWLFFESRVSGLCLLPISENKVELMQKTNKMSAALKGASPDSYQVALIVGKVKNKATIGEDPLLKMMLQKIQNDFRALTLEDQRGLIKDLCVQVKIEVENQRHTLGKAEAIISVIQWLNGLIQPFNADDCLVKLELLYLVVHLLRSDSAQAGRRLGFCRHMNETRVQLLAKFPDIINCPEAQQLFLKIDNDEREQRVSANALTRSGMGIMSSGSLNQANSSLNDLSNPKP